MLLDAPHPLHLEAEEKHAELLDADEAHTTCKSLADAHPGSQLKRQAAQAANERLQTATLADVAAREAAAAVPPTVQEQWYLVVVALHGDTPFAAKMRRTVGAAAFTGCPRCTLLASKSRPNEDGTPSSVSLKATAYGGVSRQAQYQKPVMEQAQPRLSKMTEQNEFTYEDQDGNFSKTAATDILIDDVLDELLAEAAERYTSEEQEWYTNTLRNRLQALGDNSTTAAKQAGTAHITHCLLTTATCTHIHLLFP